MATIRKCIKTNSLQWKSAFIQYNQLPKLYKVFDETAHILKKIQYSVITLYFPRRLVHIPRSRDIGTLLMTAIYKFIRWRRSLKLVSTKNNLWIWNPFIRIISEELLWTRLLTLKTQSFRYITHTILTEIVQTMKNVLTKLNLYLRKHQISTLK
jgi:hypothetical protein